MWLISYQTHLMWILILIIHKFNHCLSSNTDNITNFKKWKTCIIYPKTELLLQCWWDAQDLAKPTLGGLFFLCSSVELPPYNHSWFCGFPSYLTHSRQEFFPHASSTFNSSSRKDGAEELAENPYKCLLAQLPLGWQWRTRESVSEFLAFPKDQVVYCDLSVRVKLKMNTHFVPGILELWQGMPT